MIKINLLCAQLINSFYLCYTIYNYIIILDIVHDTNCTIYIIVNKIFHLLLPGYYYGLEIILSIFYPLFMQKFIYFHINCPFSFQNVQIFDHYIKQTKRFSKKTNSIN